jgi:hypothetical protein
MKNGIFLSYARTDDEPFVKRLYEYMTNKGFTVWWDRVKMPSRALTFLQEIRDAIHACERVVVVIGPNALRSDYVRAEWQHALAEAKVVVPLLRSGSYDNVPPELREFHCPDGTEARAENECFEEILRILSDPVPPLATVVGGAPDIPPHFQPRPTEITQIADEVLRDLKNPITTVGPQQVIIVHGMGGVGKSVLVAAFARSTTARRVFTGGIIWIVGGPETRPLTLAERLSQLLTGNGQSYSSISEATARLSEILKGRRALIVLDNIWKVEQLEPILPSLDVNTRLLVTTRDAGLVAAVGARGVDIHELSESAALHQLADWAGQNIGDLPVAATELAKECGYLPFALALNGAMLSEGHTWDDLLTALRSAELDFADKRFVNYPYPNVLKSIKVSIDHLGSSEPVAAQLYQELAAFFWHDGVPEAAVATLWGRCSRFSERETRKTLIILERKSLLRMTGEPPIRQVILHDLFVDYLTRVAKDLGKLTNELLDAYWGQCENDWPSGPKDGYFHQHLVAHLNRAGRLSEIHRLLALEAPDGRNSWYLCKQQDANVAGYLRDVDMAWRLALETGGMEMGNLCPAVLVLRYALCVTSFNSLAASVPSCLIAAAVDRGIWLIEEALAYARSCPFLEQKAKSLGILATHIAPEIRQNVYAEAIAAASALPWDYDRARVLRTLLELSDDNTKPLLLRELLPVANELEPKDFREIFQTTPHDFLGEFIPALLNRARDLSDGHRVATLTVVAPHLTGELLEETLNVVARIDDEWKLRDAVATLAPHMTAVTLDEAISWGYKTGQNVNPKWVTAFAPYVEKPALHKALAATAECAKSGDHFVFDRALMALSGMAPYLDEEMLEIALLMSESLLDPSARFSWINALYPHLSEDLQKRAHRIVSDSEEFNSEFVEKAIKVLSTMFSEEPTLTPHDIEEAEYDEVKSRQKLQQVSMMKYTYERGKALQELIPRLSPFVFDDLLKYLPTLWEGHQLICLSLIVPRLLEKDRSRVLSELPEMVARAGRDEDVGKAIEHLIPYTTDEIIRKTIYRVQRIGDDENQVLMLIALLPELPVATQDSVRGNLLDRILSHPKRAGLLEIFPYLTETEAEAALNDILLWSDPTEQQMEELLLGIAKKIPAHFEGTIQKLLAASARTSRRLALLDSLIPKLKDDHRNKAIEQWLALGPSAIDAGALDNIVPHLSNGQLCHLLQLADRGIASVRARRLAKVVRCMPEHLVEQALQLANSIKDPSDKAYVIANALDIVREERRSAMVEQILQLIYEAGSNVLEHGFILAREMGRYLTRDQLRGILEFIKRKPRKGRLSVIVELIPYVDDELAHLALEFVQSCEQSDFNRTYTTLELLAHLPANVQETVIQQVAEEILHVKDAFTFKSQLDDLLENADRMPIQLLRRLVSACQQMEAASVQFPKAGSSDSYGAYVLIKAYTALCPRVSETEAAELRQKAIPLLQNIDSAFWRKELMERLGIFNDRRRAQWFEDALIEEPDYRIVSTTEDLKKLFTEITMLPLEERLALWNGVLRRFESRGRPETLQSLRRFLRIVGSFDSGTCSEMALEAIEDVFRWWP